MNKTGTAVILFSLLIYSLWGTAPDWVISYGINTPFDNDSHLTGFAMIDNGERDAIVRSRELALADMTGKIETKVYSHITMEDREGPEGVSSSASIITRCTVDITVSGAEYIYFEDRKFTYALAYISLDRLSETYRAKAGSHYETMLQEVVNAKRFLDGNQAGQALQSLYKARKEAVNFSEQHSLYLSINSGGDRQFFSGIERLGSLREFRIKEAELERELSSLETPDSPSFGEALQKAALMLSRQGMTAGSLSVPPLTYEQSTFSSQFGRYGSAALETALVEHLPPSRDKRIYRGSYWVQGESIELSILAMNADGQKLARATVRFPYSGEITRYELEPQNFEESMTALREFAEGALTDGGINVDIWTDKGRDEDSPVYEGGETLRLFMRVNQPAFLQITYHLATGEKVLLERSFYIGMDKVNRAVKLPWDFLVQPPYGVEQLIVTAFSNEPPEPLVSVEYIDGEMYEVFRSMEAVTAQTRGLGRKAVRDVRVGEAILTLTTVSDLD